MPDHSKFNRAAKLNSIKSFEFRTYYAAEIALHFESYTWRFTRAEAYSQILLSAVYIGYEHIFKQHAKARFFNQKANSMEDYDKLIAIIIR